MARFTGTAWTNTEALDWEAGDFLRFDKFRDQVGQNIEYLYDQLSTLQTNFQKSIWFFGPAGGGPLA